MKETIVLSVYLLAINMNLQLFSFQNLFSPSVAEMDPTASNISEAYSVHLSHITGLEYLIFLIIEHKVILLSYYYYNSFCNLSVMCEDWCIREAVQGKNPAFNISMCFWNSLRTAGLHLTLSIWVKH